MYNIIKIILFTLCFSCSKHSLKVKGLDNIKAKIDAPEAIELGPDFEKAANFCDNRYLPDFDAAESCFEDYRTFYAIKVTLDLTGILDFCEANYSNNQDVEECISDLTDILNNALNNEEEE